MLKTIYQKAPAFVQCIYKDDKRVMLSPDCAYLLIEPESDDLWNFKLDLVHNKNHMFTTKTNALREFLDMQVTLTFQTLNDLVTVPNCIIGHVGSFICPPFKDYKDFEEDYIFIEGQIIGDFWLRQIADYENNQILSHELSLEEAYSLDEYIPEIRTDYKEHATQ